MTDIEKREARNAYAREYRRRPGVMKKHNEFNKAWRKKNPARVKELSRLGHIKRKERFGKLLTQQRKEYDFKKNLTRYGLTVEHYKELYAKQNGKCFICGDHSSRLHVDHNHKTNIVRALLCVRCNPGLGYFKDSIEILQKAIDYLKFFNVNC